MFIPLSDSMPCNRFVGTALYERMEAFADRLIDELCSRGQVSDLDLAVVDQPSIKVPYPRDWD
ncbi:hypothetical protein B5G34_00540 [Flavonifractor sp. An82]|uniref:hypothetical protein n=1 Tax=Flavonifractor sp. An82 TaxID=1965660 RepID=UPI000B38C2E2|nr:hypothetical protein [Flavonifractor sp. An82]OUN23621.1 hypothetical protein B5G34_00540 [Flavonifractor sp. An82]